MPLTEKQRKLIEWKKSQALALRTARSGKSKEADEASSHCSEGVVGALAADFSSAICSLEPAVKKLDCRPSPTAFLESKAKQIELNKLRAQEIRERKRLERKQKNGNFSSKPQVDLSASENERQTLPTENVVPLCVVQPAKTVIQSCNSATGSDQPCVHADRNYMNSSPLKQNAVKQSVGGRLDSGNVLTNNSNNNETLPVQQSIKKEAKVAYCYLINDGRFMVKIGFHQGVIQLFKTMETRQYEASSKSWNFSLSEYYQLVRQIKELHVGIVGLPSMVTDTFRREIRKVPVESLLSVDLSSLPSKLEESLLPFQREGVIFAIHHRGRLLIADEMGLGKTIQALAIAAYYRSEWPVLVVVPSSVRFQWKEQFSTWLGLAPWEVFVMTTGRDVDFPEDSVVHITSYDLMARLAQALIKKRYRIVIMDESHLLKNIRTARAKAAQPILLQSPRAILLTGTPALSRPVELHAQISIIDSGTFSNFFEFGKRYCAGKQGRFGWDFSGSSNLRELDILLRKKVMIRRLKKDVMSQLPAKQREVIHLNPSLIKRDKSMKSSHKKMEKLVGKERKAFLLEYFHLTAEAKVGAVQEYVTDLLQSDEKFLIFAHHQLMLDSLETLLNREKVDYIRIDGRTSSESRAALCDRFQHAERFKVALLSITAANAGLNLTAASLVVFAELYWNPGILVQAEDRVHRMGQTSSVSIRYLFGRDTADDYVWPLIKEKLEVLGKAGLGKDDFGEIATVS